MTSDDKKEVEDRNAEARVWFKGLQAIRKKVGLEAIYDLQRRPFVCVARAIWRATSFPAPRAMSHRGIDCHWKEVYGAPEMLTATRIPGAGPIPTLPTNAHDLDEAGPDRASLLRTKTRGRAGRTRRSRDHVLRLGVPARGVRTILRGRRIAHRVTARAHQTKERRPTWRAGNGSVVPSPPARQTCGRGRFGWRSFWLASVSESNQPSWLAASPTALRWTGHPDLG